MHSLVAASSSRSRSLQSFAAATLALVLATSVLGCPTQPATPTPASVATKGGLAPDFEAQDIDGHPVKLSNHLGKQVILLDFCSSWCVPCVIEFPHLRALYEANKSKGFLILAISVDGPETAANVPGFARRNRLSFPMMIDEDSRISSLYNPKRTAPLSILIDRAGRVASVREGFTQGDEESLATQVAKALGGTGASAAK